MNYSHYERIKIDRRVDKNGGKHWPEAARP
jgi:hypothetical protein